MDQRTRSTTEAWCVWARPVGRSQSHLPQADLSGGTRVSTAQAPKARIKLLTGDTHFSPHFFLKGTVESFQQRLLQAGYACVVFTGGWAACCRFLLLPAPVVQWVVVS